MRERREDRKGRTDEKVGNKRGNERKSWERVSRNKGNRKGRVEERRGEEMMKGYGKERN